MNMDAERTLRRLAPRLASTFFLEIASDSDGWDHLLHRLDAHFEALFEPLCALYGNRFDFFYHLERFLNVAVRAWFERPAKLRALDARRDADPAWFTSNGMMGGVCYVDLFAGDLGGVRNRIPYFQELGLTYLHLMPLFRAPEGNSDGGYAVSSYRDVNPALGTMEDLRLLATELREAGISLVLDFVFNHTSDEHPWAVEARQFPDDEERNCYLMFPDRTMPDAYDATLREIFPDQRPGSFTWVPDAGEHGRWVWTTFHSFQWDLNYANPLVFERMAEEMLFLANQGVEILRLDAVAFIWKRVGTVCESLPEAHLLVHAFNAMARIATPSLLFKSEAIVHPAEVATYIDAGECQLSYNPLLMALLWETLATRNAQLLRRSMQHWFTVPGGTAWVNYVRSHDDIGWTFDDWDAGQLGINGYDHRRFLNAFYTGRFPGSFARGLPFQENPKTGDCRISGTAASLAGLEKALSEEGPEEVELAIRRILLLYSVVLSIGGVPLLYLGDELGTLNDRSFASDPERAEDSRWVHRVARDQRLLEQRRDEDTVAGRIFCGIQRLVATRTANEGFGGTDAEFLEPGNDHVFAYRRTGSGVSITVVANVTEQSQTVSLGRIGIPESGAICRELISERTIAIDGSLTLAPYQVYWLETKTASD